MKSKKNFLTMAALVLALSGSPSVQGQFRNPSTVQGQGQSQGQGQYQYREPNRLTGSYRLNSSRSDNPTMVADKVSRNLAQGRQQDRTRNQIMKRLENPEVLVFDVQGRMVTMASTHSDLVTFEANGRAISEQTRNGRVQQTTPTLTGQRLSVTTTGDQTIDYQVTFELIDAGRSLRVIRSITDPELRRPVVATSIYDRALDTARWEYRNVVGNQNPPARLAARDTWIVPDGTALSATLNDNLSTRQARDGDHFTMTVQSPAQYRGATIEGHVVQASRSNQLSGRAEMALDFDRIRMRDGRLADFSAYIESARTASGQSIRVDSEGSLRDHSQTERTATRTGIGAAIGAVIGAIADGGKGAAIGALVGGGAGAGSVFVQGRGDLDLIGGTEFTLRAKNL